MMQKSMVHQLNGLTTSQLFNRSAFITTSHQQQDFQLRKSRIQNLPSYRKQDLSSKVNFVVVFQTIEIQRLSSQVQALRVALKDAEHQNFNMKSYQVQIRQLTQKCYNYQKQRQEYLQEIDRMNLICQKIYQQLQDMKQKYANIDPTINQKYRIEKQKCQHLQDEMEKWRVRYQALEKSKNKEMEDMRLMLESQRKSILDRQIKQLTIKYKSELQNLQNQLRKLRQALSSKQYQLNRANSQISRLQAVNQQLRQYQYQIEQYQNKFAMISQETMRMNQILRNKQEEIDKLSAEINKKSRRISQLERLLQQQKQGGEKVRMLQGKVRDWETKCSRLEDEKRRNDIQLKKIPEFQSMINQINNQTQKLKDAVRQKMGQIEQWRYKYNTLANEHQQAKAEKQRQMPMLESKINQMSNQNNRLNDVLKNRTGQIQNWKNKCNDIQRQITRYVNIQREKKDLDDRLDAQIRNNNDLQRTNRSLEGRVQEIPLLQRNLDNQKQQKQQCFREIQRLNTNIGNITNRAEDLNRKCMNLQNQLNKYMRLQEQIRIHRQKQINFTKEIDRINNILNQKIRQVQALKQTFQRIQSAMAQYKGLQQKLMETMTQMQKLMAELQQSRKQSGFYQEKCFGLEGQVRKNKNQILLLNQERQQAVRIINSKVKQLQNSEYQNQQLRGQVNNLKQKEARLRQIQEKYRMAQNKINDYQRKLKSQQNRVNELNMNLQKTTLQLDKIKRQGMMSPQFKQQFFKLKLSNEEKQRQIRNLQMRIQQIQNILRRVNQSIRANEQIAKRNKQKWIYVGKQIQVFLRSMQKMGEMQNQIMRLNEENMKLQSQVRLMNVQIQDINFKKSMIRGSRVSEDDYDTLGSRYVKRNSGETTTYGGGFGGIGDNSGFSGATGLSGFTSTSRFESSNVGGFGGLGGGKTFNIGGGLGGDTLNFKDNLTGSKLGTDFMTSSKFNTQNLTSSKIGTEFSTSRFGTGGTMGTGADKMANSRFSNISGYTGISEIGKRISTDASGNNQTNLTTNLFKKPSQQKLEFGNTKSKNQQKYQFQF